MKTYIFCELITKIPTVLLLLITYKLHLLLLLDNKRKLIHKGLLTASLIREPLEPQEVSSEEKKFETFQTIKARAKVKKV